MLGGDAGAGVATVFTTVIILIFGEISPKSVAKNKKINELMRELQQQKMHIAVVMDEYGETAGIVTLEDILEELVGETVGGWVLEEFGSIPEWGASFERDGLRVEVTKMTGKRVEEVRVYLTSRTKCV